MEKVSVDKEKCIGCGACVALVGDIFEFGDDGLAQAIDGGEIENLSEDVMNDLEDAIDGCPVGAIEKK